MKWWETVRRKRQMAQFETGATGPRTALFVVFVGTAIVTLAWAAFLAWLALKAWSLL